MPSSFIFTFSHTLFKFLLTTTCNLSHTYTHTHTHTHTHHTHTHTHSITHLSTQISIHQGACGSSQESHHAAGGQLVPRPRWRGPSASTHTLHLSVCLTIYLSIDTSIKQPVSLSNPLLFGSLLLFSLSSSLFLCLSFRLSIMTLRRP